MSVYVGIDLGGAAEDGLHPGVGVGPRDRVLGHVPVAAEQLQAPSLIAVVRMPCRSLPAPGSVIAIAPMHSPVAIGGSQRLCCSSVPRSTM